MSRLIMHLDMDAFFAAVEQRDNPAYRGRPVIVGAEPGKRGVVSTCSYEARAFGVRSAMPISEAWRRCPKGVYLRPDMEKYAAVSDRLMQLLETVSPVVEPASIDEAFLDVTGLEKILGSPLDIGRHTKELVRRELALTASIGIAPNRPIAKLASDYRKPDGLTIIAADEVLGFLSPLPVGKLAGVGVKGQQVCVRLGLKTIGDLREFGLPGLQREFGVKTGHYLYDRARGLGSDEVGMCAPRKSLSKEVTFEKDVSDTAILHDTLLRLAEDVGRGLRQEGKAGRTATLKIRLANFETHTRQRHLEEATDSDRIIFREAWNLFQCTGFAGRTIRLIGIGMSGLTDMRGQGALFEGGKDSSNKESKLFEAIDRIRKRHGSGSIGLGGLRKPGKTDE